ncbi:putative ubiquitin carboxyl-terminal hydrolase MINDY-4 [Nymphon striatum]|nr:putative ubiquitin carboxyl-terminal hydrolase MINDY-4 [Nymphon striatum]
MLDQIFGLGTSNIKLYTNTNKIRLEKGVRQGDSISPKLFTACLENVFRGLNWTSKGIPINGDRLTNLRFADDVVLFSESLQELQLMVEELRTASSNVGLEINLSKTKVMFNRNVEILPIMTENVALDQVDRYIYLGQLISIHRNREPEVRRRVALGWQAFGRLNNVWRSKLPLCLKRKVEYKTIQQIDFTSAKMMKKLDKKNQTGDAPEPLTQYDKGNCQISKILKDQRSSDQLRRELAALNVKVGIDLQPVFTSKKLDQVLDFNEQKPPIINNNCIVYSFKCDLCDASYLKKMENSKEIDLETALNLRQTIFGQSNFVTGLEWLKSGFKFRKEHNLSFGLDVKKANLKAPMMCVQAYILKHLFFAPQNKGRSHYYNGPEEDHTSIAESLNPDVVKQRKVLTAAITDIIWKSRVGQSNCVVGIPHEETYIQSQSTYQPDGITEQIKLFTFEDYKRLQEFISENSQAFEDGPGFLILLYSIVLTRTPKQISEDLCGEFHQLLQVVSTRQSNQALVNLLLTGVATPFIHNGKILEGNTHVRSLNGIISRSEFGFLIWCNDNAVVRELGSRLKTPFLPIWITCCNDQYGILFNHNIDLVRDHKAEYFFKLFFYNSSQHVEKLATLTIDSRHNEIMEEDNELVPLQCLISTK